MKRTILNLGAILMAFLIGLAINNACADSLDNMSDSELRKLVSQMQQEITSLKQRVSELESQIASSGSSASSGSGFDVDGIHFTKAGFPEDKTDYYEYSGYTISNGVRSELTGYRYDYAYDSYGRVTKFGNQEYSYSTKQYQIEIKSSSDNYQSYQQFVYHLK